MQISALVSLRDGSRAVSFANRYLVSRDAHSAGCERRTFDFVRPFHRGRSVNFETPRAASALQNKRETDRDEH